MGKKLVPSESRFKPLLAWQLWTPPFAIALLLIVVSRHSYLAFHTFAELFAIVISYLIFAFAWSTRRFSRNNFLLFLACGYFWIGSLDLMHTLSYKGMDVFVEGSGNLSVQFWIGTRYFEALVLLAAPFAATRRQNGYLLVSIFGIVAVGLTTLILIGKFPVGFVEGTGLTSFKIYSEYLIDLILAAALVTLFRNEREISSDEKSLIAAAIVMTMCAELAFTFYIDVYGLSNLTGHIFKLFSFWLIFQAIVITHLTGPYTDLQEGEREYRNMLNTMADTFYRADLEGRLVMISPSVVNIGGYSAEELIGKEMAQYYVGENERAEIIERLEADDGKVSEFEAEMYNKEGGTIWTSIRVRHWKDASGTVLGTEGTIRNITEHKTAEEALRRSQKLEAVGQLTGGIAHDYNNMLGVIIGNIQLIQGAGELGEKSRQRLDTAFAAAQRNAELTSKLLGFSRVQAIGTRLAAVNNFIENLQEILATSLTASVKVESSLAANLWLVDIDPADLEDMILNLAINARDAMPGGGVLKIETANKVLDDNYVKHIPGARPGDYVMISVADTGVGMTKDVSEKIFDPFFTTKDPGQGTGLGLSMVYAFVKRSGGFIKVYSETGLGAAFHVFLPRALEKTSDLATPEHVVLPETCYGTETVLVVDDEDFLVELAVTHLESLGYRTLVARDGEQALKMLEIHPDIDLLFSDIIMPGKIDGYHLAQAAMRGYPSLKVLLTSGFAKNRSRFIKGRDKAIARLATDLLSKPYTLEELATAVRHTLDATD